MRLPFLRSCAQASEALACSAILPNAALSCTARSASTLRSMSMDALGDIVAQARREFAAAADPAALENAKARYVGKAGAITTRLKALATLAP